MRNPSEEWEEAKERAISNCKELRLEYAANHKNSFHNDFTGKERFGVSFEMKEKGE